MSNIKDNSIVALLDVPEYMNSVLDTSIWVSDSLDTPIALLYSMPSIHKMQAVNYSGCLNIDEEEHLLHALADEEFVQNLERKNQGQQILKQAQDYCKNKHNQQSYPLYRQSSIEESIQYVDENVELIVIGDNLTCESSISRLIRPVHSPILLTHSPFIQPKSALFAFDNKQTCQSIVEQLLHGVLHKLITNIQLHIVMIATPDHKNQEVLDSVCVKLLNSGIDCVAKLINIRQVTNVPSALLSYQQTHDLELLITGAFGQSRLLEWIQGSDTEALLLNHKTPYLLFPKV